MLFFLILSISIIAKAKSGGPLPLDHGPVRGCACRRSEGIQEAVQEPSRTELDLFHHHQQQQHHFKVIKIVVSVLQQRVELNGARQGEAEAACQAPSSP